jgi:hypothetical protein
VTFDNQVVSSGSVPDARISGRFTWWFETKTGRGGYAAQGHDREQLRGHARLLTADPDALLFVLTPDPVRPSWFDAFDDGVERAARSRIVWLSFLDLATAISEIADDASRLLGEQTRFLLSELVALFEADGLLTNDDTVVVAARASWPEYLEIGAYVCQPNRAFWDGLTHLGFYANGAIQRLVPRIREHHDSVLFTAEEVERLRRQGANEVAELVERQLDAGERTEGDAYGVILLTASDDPTTLQLEHAIENDLVAASGRARAWVLGQRYASTAKLKRARVTSEL